MTTIIEVNQTWLTVEEAANYLGRSVRAIYNMVHKGQLPYHKFSGRLLFLKDELDSAVKACRVQSLFEVTGGSHE